METHNNKIRIEGTKEEADDELERLETKSPKMGAEDDFDEGDVEIDSYLLDLRADVEP